MNINVGLRSRNTNFNVSTADVDLTGRTSKFGAWTKAYNHDREETVADVAFPGITYLPGYVFPETFNAIHMSLIPKGPNKGKLVVWDNAPVLAVWPTISATDLWSYQAWAIVDPVDEPAGVRFSNHLFPVGIVEGSIGAPETIRIPNLFCAGHAWTPNGDLLVAGGMRWDLAVNQYPDNKVFIWAPSLDMTVHLTTDAGVTDRDLTLTGGHYTAQKGAWLQAKSLSSAGSVDGRYYPGVDMTPTLGRTTKVHALITGGSDDLLLANQTLANNSTWNTYESYIIDAAPTTTTSGLVKDDIGPGTDVWNGPMDVGANEPFMDSLYFYPRMFNLTSGGMFMAGMVPQSAFLADHSGAPGTWLTTQGHNLGITGNLDEFRYYGSAVQLQNFQGHADVIYRMGGAQIPPFIDWTAGVDPDREFDTNSVEVIYPTAGGSEQWAPAPDMRVPRQFLNTVVLPDASILALGGMDWQPETEPPVPHEFLVHGSGHLEDDFKYHTAAEVLMPGASKWVAIDWNRALSVRGYHQTAVLLPDGRVFVGGGEGRRHDGGYDYEVFEPHYLMPEADSPYRPTRPTNLVLTEVGGGAVTADSDGTYPLTYANEYQIVCDTLPQYRKLTMVALTPCGSVTHHYSNSSKHRTLVVTEVNATTIRFTTPADEQAWQKGYHLLWVLTDQGVPAEALWVKF